VPREPAGGVTTEDDSTRRFRWLGRPGEKRANEAEARKTAAQTVEKLTEQRKVTPAGLKVAALKRW